MESHFWWQNYLKNSSTLYFMIHVQISSVSATKSSGFSKTRYGKDSMMFPKPFPLLSGHITRLCFQASFAGGCNHITDLGPMGCEQRGYAPLPSLSFKTTYTQLLTLFPHPGDLQATRWRWQNHMLEGRPPKLLTQQSPLQIDPTEGRFPKREIWLRSALSSSVTDFILLLFYPLKRNNFGIINGFH